MLRTTGTQSSKVSPRSLPVLPPTTGPICSVEPSPIEGLPTELLQEVFELLDRNSLWSCMRVCGRWYDIARPYFFAVLPVRHCHHRQAFKCLRSHPGLAARITELHFFDKSCGGVGSSRGDIPRGSFDIDMLASALPLFTNLRALCFEGYDIILNRPSLLSRLLQTPQRQTVTASLQRLSFEHCGGSGSVVPELLSLFSVKTLVIDIRLSERYNSNPLAPTPEPSISPASITLQNLVIGREAHLRGHLSFFERALVPGSLRGLATARCSPFVERFLQSGASRNLLSISVTLVCEYAAAWLPVATASNGAYAASHSPCHPAPAEPFDSMAGRTVCEALGAALGNCTRLQYVQLGFRHRDDSSADLLSKPDGLLPIVANLPRRTLRVFAVKIWLHTPRPWCCTSSPIGLDTVDRMLAPGAPSGGGRGGRFSDLRRVELNVYREGAPPRSTCQCTKPFHKHNPGTLPRLYAAGLLRSYVGRVNNDKPIAAKVYWPSDE